MLTNWFSWGELKFEFPAEVGEIVADLRKIVDSECDADVITAKSNSEKKEVIQLQVQSMASDADKVDSDDDDFPEYEIPDEELGLRKVCIISSTIFIRLF